MKIKIEAKLKSFFKTFSELTISSYSIIAEMQRPFLEALGMLFLVPKYALYAFSNLPL